MSEFSKWTELHLQRRGANYREARGEPHGPPGGVVPAFASALAKLNRMTTHPE